jgi:eukaryotic-like serine/threonine-protein kinase
MGRAAPEERTIAGRYRLVRRIGSGGMATVWLADDPMLQRHVAVKEVRFASHSDGDSGDTVRARFLREARAAARLNHPHVTTIYDVLQERDAAFIVMELVDAPTLENLVRRAGPLAPSRAVAVGLDVLAALEAAHREGIVHRDVKPGNVMVREDGPAKLTDFGVAALVGHPRLTTTGLIVGSPAYMAPEQARGEATSPATDLWGLGATLYFAVEAIAPFDRGATIPTLTAVATEPPPPPTRADALAPLLLDLLAKDPRDRPAAEEVDAELRRLADDSAGTTRVLPASPPPRSTARLTPAPAHPTGPVRQRPSPWRAAFAVTAGLVALAVAGVLAAWWLSTGRPAEQGGEQARPPAAPPREEPNEGLVPADPEADAAATDAAAPEPGGPPAEPPLRDEAVPEGWAVFPIGPTGASVAHPADWTQRQQAENRTDLVDPNGGRYLRVEWTDNPREDPVADWERQSQAFGQRYAGYEEIGIDPTEIRGHDAALWEYRYVVDGVQLHAYNLGINAGDYGFALNFQTREEQWDASQGLWELFVASFATG